MVEEELNRKPLDNPFEKEQQRPPNDKISKRMSMRQSVNIDTSSFVTKEDLDIMTMANVEKLKNFQNENNNSIERSHKTMKL